MTAFARWIRFLACLAVGSLFCPIAAGADEPGAPIKVGIIGLDSYHSVAFTQLFHQPKVTGDLAGIKVVCGFPAGSPDIGESVENLPKWKKGIQEYGVEIVDSIDALLKKVDGVILCSL